MGCICCGYTYLQLRLIDICQNVVFTDMKNIVLHILYNTSLI